MTARRNRSRQANQRKRPYIPPPPPEPTSAALAIRLVERGLATKAILTVDDYMEASTRKRIENPK